MDYKKVKVGLLYRYVGSSELIVKALKPAVSTMDRKDGILYCKVVVGNKNYRKGWKMNVYTSSIVSEYTNVKVIPQEKVNLQELALVELNLTNLQIVTLNGIAANIANGEDTYASNADSLSEQEDRYLRAWLGNEGIKVSKVEG